MLDPRTQADFSAGMWRGVDAAQIPPNGALDVIGLLTAEGDVAQRGGSYYASVGNVQAMHGVWSGETANGHRTVIFSDATVEILNADTTLSALGVTPTKARPALYRGILYWDQMGYDGAAALGAVGPAGTNRHFAVVAGKLFCAYDSSSGVTVAFSGVGTTVFAAGDFHVLPGGAKLRAIYPLRNALAVFTTAGLYVISGVENTLTDGAGNVQHRVDLYSDDVVAASSWGICGYEGGLVVPTDDGVWTVSLGVTSEAPLPLQKISTAVDGLFGPGAGYVLGGQAEVVNGHYLLPLTETGEGIASLDAFVLVCRLKPDRRGRRFAWSRLRGYGAEVRAVGYMRDSSGNLTLVAGAYPTGRRLLACGWFLAANGVQDADGSTTTARVVSRDIATGSLTANTVAKVRVGYYVADGAVTAAASVAHGYAGPENVGTPLTALSGSGDETAESKTFPFGKKGRFVRVAVDASSSTGLGGSSQEKPALIRSIEVFIRSSGRQ